MLTILIYWPPLGDDRYIVAGNWRSKVDWAWPRYGGGRPLEVIYVENVFVTPNGDHWVDRVAVKLLTGQDKLYCILNLQQENQREVVGDHCNQNARMPEGLTFRSNMVAKEDPVPSDSQSVRSFLKSCFRISNDRYSKSYWCSNGNDGGWGAACYQKERIAVTCTRYNTVQLKLVVKMKFPSIKQPSPRWAA